MSQPYQYGLLIAWLCAVAGLVLLVIAINTDNWIVYDIAESPEIRLKFYGSPYAYDRSMGLFRECFVGDYPPPIDVAYTTALGKRCLNVIGRWLYPRQEIAEITQVKLHSQAVWAQLITGGGGMVFLVVGLTVGFTAWCVRFPPTLIVTTGSCFLISLTLIGTSVGLWHASSFMRQDSIQLEGYYAHWPTEVKNATRAHYDWSYMAAWSGAICLLLSSFLQLVCYCIAKSHSEDKYNQKMMSLYKRRRQRHEMLGTPSGSCTESSTHNPSSTPPFPKQVPGPHPFYDMERRPKKKPHRRHEDPSPDDAYPDDQYRKPRRDRPSRDEPDRHRHRKKKARKASKHSRRVYDAKLAHFGRPGLDQEIIVSGGGGVDSSTGSSDVNPSAPPFGHNPPRAGGILAIQDGLPGGPTRLADRDLRAQQGRDPKYERPRAVMNRLGGYVGDPDKTIDPMVNHQIVARKPVTSGAKLLRRSVNANINSGNNNNNNDNNGIHDGPPPGMVNADALVAPDVDALEHQPVYEIYDEQNNRLHPRPPPISAGKMLMQRNNHLRTEPIYESNGSVHGKPGGKHGPKPVNPSDMIVVTSDVIEGHIPRRN